MSPQQHCSGKHKFRNIRTAYKDRLEGCWIQLLQVRFRNRSGKTVMDKGIITGRKVWSQLRMRSLVIWFKEKSLDCRMYTMHVSATYREIRNILVTAPSVTSQHMRVGLMLPSARTLRSLSSQALPAEDDESSRL
jgi:hypothetical protein